MTQVHSQACLQEVALVAEQEDQLEVAPPEEERGRRLLMVLVPAPPVAGLKVVT